MTGDGAVVRVRDIDREWTERHVVAAPNMIWMLDTIRQQAAEIERLKVSYNELAIKAFAYRERAEASEARAADLLKALKSCRAELLHLFAMVEGEVPSLLEDHHSYPKIIEALELGEAAIAAAKGGTV